MAVRRSTLTHTQWTAGEVPAGSFTLGEAARLIGIDLKTLHRRLEVAHIVPTRSNRDGRVRLLTRQQVRALTPAATHDWSAEELAMKVLQEKDEKLAHEAALLKQRERELDDRLNRFESLVTAITDELGPKIEQLLAQSGVQRDAPETSIPAAPVGPRRRARLPK